MTEILAHLKRANEKNSQREGRIVENSHHIIGTDVCPKQTSFVRMAG